METQPWCTELQMPDKVSVTVITMCIACLVLHADLIQAALLVCGFMTAIQVTGIRFPSSSPYQWGAGILSVMGISFASVPLFTSVITANMVSRASSASSVKATAAVSKLGMSAQCYRKLAGQTCRPEWYSVVRTGIQLLSKLAYKPCKTQACRPSLPA